MDGMHDLGGRQGFGRVRYTLKAPDLPRAAGRSASTRSTPRGQARHLQHGRVPPRDRAHGAAALSSGQLLRTLADEPRTLCIEKGIFTKESSSARRRHVSALAAARPRPQQRGRRAKLQVGDRCACAPTTSRASCACRLHPRQDRRRRRESPAYPFPDAHAHGVDAEDEPTYDVPASTPRNCGPTRPTRRRSMSACSRATWIAPTDRVLALTASDLRPVRHEKM
jgi:nitrile hydratase